MRHSRRSEKPEKASLTFFDIPARLEKSPRVFVLGIRENMRRWSVLDKGTVVHDRDSLADLADDFEIV